MRKSGHAPLSSVLVAACALGWAGCSPPSEAEQEYQAAREREAERREMVRSSLEGGSDESAAIRMAKESPAAEGDGTAEQWVARQLARNTGNVLFPHWQARRYGLDKYEVSFTYTLMNELGEIEKKGYAWKVDLVLKGVAPVRVMTAEELSAGLPRRTPRRARTGGLPEIQLNE